MPPMPVKVQHLAADPQAPRLAHVGQVEEEDQDQLRHHLRDSQHLLGGMRQGARMASALCRKSLLASQYSTDPKKMSIGLPF